MDKPELARLIEAAISSGGGFVDVMAQGRSEIQRDIPVAFELYALLGHFLEELPLIDRALSGDESLPLQPGICVDHAAGRVVAMVPVAAGELSALAFWLADGMRNDEVKRRDGILALPFSIEEHAETTVLLPEWFAAFYAHGSADHCTPMLAMQSVMTDDRFGSNWVELALARMAVFCLPSDRAAEAVRAATAPIKQSL